MTRNDVNRRAFAQGVRAYQISDRALALPLLGRLVVDVPGLRQKYRPDVLDRSDMEEGYGILLGVGGLCLLAKNSI